MEAILPVLIYLEDVSDRAADHWLRSVTSVANSCTTYDAGTVPVGAGDTNLDQVGAGRSALATRFNILLRSAIRAAILSASY